jgi:hypothetical protein
MENSVIPLKQKKMILKDFVDHSLTYMMKYNFFNEFKKIKVIIQLLIF